MSPDADSAQRVMIVDDAASIRRSLCFLLRSRGIAGVAYDGAPALLAALDTAKLPPRGCFLLDIRMEPMSGRELLRALQARALANPVLFLSGHGDIDIAVEALKSGAFDFIQKPYSDNSLVDRIEAALAVEATLQARNAQAAERAARLASLTPRERDVMWRVAAGKPNKIIAAELNLALRTVEVYRARVYAKMGVRSAAELATLLAQCNADLDRHGR